MLVMKKYFFLKELGLLTNLQRGKVGLGVCRVSVLSSVLVA